MFFGVFILPYAMEIEIMFLYYSIYVIVGFAMNIIYMFWEEKYKPPYYSITYSEILLALITCFICGPIIPIVLWISYGIIGKPVFKRDKNSK